MAKFSEDDLENLYRLAVEDGWEALEQGERVAVARWCKKTGKPNPRDMQVAPTNVERADAAVAELDGDGASGEPADVMVFELASEGDTSSGEPAAGAPVSDGRRVLADCLGGVFASLSRLQTVAFNQRDQVCYSYASGLLSGELAQLAANYGREA